MIQQLISSSTVLLCSSMEQEKAIGFSSPAAADKVDLPGTLGEVIHQLSVGYFLVAPLLLSIFFNQHLPMNKPSLTSKIREKESRTSPPHTSVGASSDRDTWGAVMTKEIRALWWQFVIPFPSDLSPSQVFSPHIPLLSHMFTSLHATSEEHSVSKGNHICREDAVCKLFSVLHQRFPKRLMPSTQWFPFYREHNCSWELMWFS